MHKEFYKKLLGEGFLIKSHLLMHLSILLAHQSHYKSHSTVMQMKKRRVISSSLLHTTLERDG
jgi:hypothetical protein